MKRSIIIAAVAIAATTLSSCRKEHTCTCKITLPFVGTQEFIKAEAKSTKKNAEAWCEAYEKEVTAQVGLAPTCTVD
ncbi:MAG: hypothetical protein KF900_03065 [Bacteroidetes bacterium]|nr:hypothetical protein [Bacteroidota bacterium]